MLILEPLRDLILSDYGNGFKSPCVLPIWQNPIDFLLCVICQESASGVLIDHIQRNSPLKLNSKVKEVIHCEILPFGTS